MRSLKTDKFPGGGVRPKLDENSTTERVQIVAPASWMKKVDDWRRKHPDLPNRSAAIRMLVEQALTNKTHENE